MWSNGFWHAIEIAIPDPDAAVRRWFGRELLALGTSPSGRWLLTLDDESPVAARLERGWIAGGGRVVGLRWITSDGRRVECGLYCARPGARRWRRLLVRLRVPLSGRLS